MQPLLLVPLRPIRVEDPGDHRRHVEAPLGDLGDDDVRVVAVGRGDEGVGPIDPGRVQRLDLERGADRELAAHVLPGALEADLEPRVRLRVLVEAGDLVALAQQRPGQRGADPARADDEDEHGSRILVLGRVGARAPARLPPSGECPVAAPASSGGAVSSTRQGALRSTYSVTGPISAGRAPPTPPRIAPPRIRVGGSPPITITSTPRSRAVCDDPRPDVARPDHRRVHLHRLVLLAHLARALERRVGRLHPRPRGGGEVSGTVSGMSIT